MSLQRNVRGVQGNEQRNTVLTLTALLFASCTGRTGLESITVEGDEGIRVGEPSGSASASDQPDAATKNGSSSSTAGNDAGPTATQDAIAVSFELGALRVVEGRDRALVVLVAAVAPTQPLSIPIRVGGTAIGQDVDHSLSNSAVVMSAGETRVEFEVTVHADALFESEETIELELSATSSVLLGERPAMTIAIEDDDSTPCSSPLFDSSEPGVHEWTVPGRVARVGIYAWGAGGGGGGQGTDVIKRAGSGGGGGLAFDELELAANDTLELTIGAGGEAGIAYSGSATGGGGGGATLVARGGENVLVAGAGGGGGGRNDTTGLAGSGGAGGGEDGEDAEVEESWGYGTGGRGATYSTGGFGGATLFASSSAGGASGLADQGGDGGLPGAGSSAGGFPGGAAGGQRNFARPGGGGGGAGLFGGGGGGAGTYDGDWDEGGAAGGGGGGSSLGATRIPGARAMAALASFAGIAATGGAPDQRGAAGRIIICAR